MVWIEKHKRSDKVVSAYLVWRLGGGRDGEKQFETFSAGTTEQNLARVEGFKKMVVSAGSSWPDGWVKGEGFVRPRGGDPTVEAPAFPVIGEEYVRQIVDITPGQRKKYLSQIRTLATTEIRGVLPFERSVSAIGEQDIKAWLIDWDPCAQDEGELPRPDVRRLQLRRRAGLPHGQSVCPNCAEASTGQAVPGGAALPL